MKEPVKINRILLIHSSHYDDEGRVVRADTLYDRLTVANLVHMALPLLASYIPSYIEVELVEDCFEEVNFDDPAEVVCISAQVMQCDRADDLADEFQKRGKVVLMGGYYPTMHPDRASLHSDAICTGEADKIFTSMLDDIERGELKPLYQGSSDFSLDDQPTPRYDLIKRSHFTFYPVQVTRGCPFKCDYCSIVEFANFSYRKRPVEAVIADIRAANHKMIYFIDDNLMEDINYSKSLFKKMQGLGIEWGVQTTINCANDSELLDLAYAAGCRFVSIGMESLDQASLDGVNKGFNQLDHFKQQVEAIHRSGISAHILIIVGLDGDSPEIYQRTMDFLNEMNIAIAEFFLCTPYPATKMGQRMIDADRIIDTNLAHYREGHVVFKHPTLTPEEILEWYWKLMRSFYHPWRMVARILRGNYRNKLYHIFNAIFYYLKIRRDIVPVYLGRGNRRVETTGRIR
jgi:radical SAM superfamily enzyme YgiQ (UPF0313 family)